MDVALKNKNVERIIQSNDDELLNEIKSLVGLSEKDFWNDLPIEVKQSINEAKDQMDRGEGTPHHEVMARMKARFLDK